MRKGLIVAHLLTLVLVAAGLAGCNSNEDEASSEQVFEVKRGDLLISVTSDGNLVMPQAFDLHFGAPGDVKDVLVEEGDFVKAGTVLATLDNTAQRLDIMSANNNVQTVLSNLYETVPLLPCVWLPRACTKARPLWAPTTVGCVPVWDRPRPSPRRLTSWRF